jgi:hypothetical protein
MTNPMLSFFSHVFRAALIWMLLSATAFPMWEESQSEHISSEVQSPRISEPVSSSDQNIQARRKRDVSVGFLLLIILGIISVTFAVMVILWGFQVRRIARNRVSKRTLEDPLWYLKPNKSQETLEKTDSKTQTPNPGNNNLEST